MSLLKKYFIIWTISYALIYIFVVLHIIRNKNRKINLDKLTIIAGLIFAVTFIAGMILASILQIENM